MQYLLNEDEYNKMDSQASHGRRAMVNITMIRRDFSCPLILGGSNVGGYCGDCVFSSTTHDTPGLCMLGYPKNHSK